MASEDKNTYDNLASMGPLAIAGVEPYKEQPGEEYMNDRQKSHFRKILTAWRDMLRSEVDRTVGHMKNEATNFPDPLDRASQEEEFALEASLEIPVELAEIVFGPLDRYIKKIEKTLNKIDRDEFGYCDQCGIEIGIKRLEARPTADLCVDCKALAEIKEKQLEG